MAFFGTAPNSVQVGEWEEGKLLIDDTIQYEAWNASGENRIVLIFDVWRRNQRAGAFELTVLFSD